MLTSARNGPWAGTHIAPHYVQPASGARAACAMVNNFVANVCTPANASVRQVINHSKVAGNLILLTSVYVGRSD